MRRALPFCAPLAAAAAAAAYCSLSHPDRRTPLHRSNDCSRSRGRHANAAPRASGRTALAAESALAESLAEDDCVDGETSQLAKRQRAMSYLRFVHAMTGTPGIAVAVVHRGQTVFAEGGGLADVENSVPMTSETVLRVASISKAYTSLALAKLVQSGKLALDGDVREQLPEYMRALPILQPSSAGQVLTPRLLASHLGGIRHYKGDEFFSKTSYASVFDAVNNSTFASEERLAHNDFLYSSHSYSILSAVMEYRAGQPFSELMMNEVFLPLAMFDTRTEQHAGVIPDRGRQYVRDKKTGVLENAPWVDNSLKVAGGGFLSSVKDIVRFGEYILHADPSIQQLLWSRQLCQDRFIDYGLGWEIIDSRNAPIHNVRSETIFYHRGSACGGTSILMVLPEDDLVIGIVCNLPISGIREIACRFGNIWMC